MLARTAMRFAALALATAWLAATAAAQQPFVPGKDGAHPHIVGDVVRTVDYEGIWQNAPEGSEPGWAIAIGPRGDGLVATWFAYDADGSPTWLRLEATDLSSRLSTGIAPGTLFAGEFRRPYASPAQPPGELAYAPALLEFVSSDLARLHYEIDGEWRTKSIARTYFAQPADPCALAQPLRGLWTGAARSDGDAEGLHVAQQGAVVVALWFGFDARGLATWRLMSASPSAPGAWSGTLYAARGPALDAPFDPSRVSVAAEGSATLALEGGSLTLAVDGRPAGGPFARQPPAAPCE